MLAELFGILWVAAPVAIHVEEARGVEAEDLAAILDATVGAVERRTGERPASGAPARVSPCEGSAECLDRIRTIAGAAEVLLLRLFGGPTRIRIAAQRIGAAGGPIATASVDLKRPRDGLERSLDGLALSLYPEAVEPPGAPRASVAGSPPVVAALPEPAAEAAPSLVPPIVAAGVAVAAAGVGIAFGVRSRDVATEGMTMPHDDDEVLRLQNTKYETALAANVLFGLAGVAAVTSLVLYLFR